jgi:adenosine deaminase
MKLTGYHGTNAESADDITKMGYKKSSDLEWFGSGIYFFESYDILCDGFIEARDWAKHVKKFQNWAIFEAVIESNKYIDIAFEIEHKIIYDKIKEKAILKHKAAGKNIKDFKEKAIFIEMEKLDIDFVRALVDSKKNLGYYSYTIRRPQLQICVKNDLAIISNELVKKEWVR